MPVLADTYATATDLTNWLAPDAAPANADRLRRSATLVIAEAANRDPYTDAPTGTDVAPLRDAVCAQVAAWIAAGVDPAKLGVLDEAPVKKASINGADVEYDTKTQTEARSLAARELAPQAESILMAAGLLWVATPLADTSGLLPTFGLTRPVWPLAPDIDYGTDWPWLT